MLARWDDMPEIIDNFLSEDVFLPIQKVLMGAYFPWYYNNCTTFADDDKRYLTLNKTTDIFDYQFIHSFYHLKQGVGVVSYFELVEPIIKKLDCFCF